MHKNMMHLNHNLMCAVDCETTGLEAGVHEIWQLCLLPLDENLEISRHLPPFDVYIKPRHPELASVPPKRFETATELGIDSFAAFELFENWYRSLGLAEKRRIVPLAHNWAFEHRFYIEWMGFHNFSLYFDSRARDTMMLAQMMNDQAEFNSVQVPFPNATTLSAIATRMKVEVLRPLLHDAVYDAAITAKTYKKMLKEVTLL